MLYLKTILRTLLLPPGGLLLLAGFGLLLQRYRPLLGRGLTALCIATLWVLSLPIVGHGLTSLTEHFGPIDLTHPSDAQAIVILGGGGYADLAPEYGGPSARFIMLERVVYGAYVARKTALPVLTTGNGGEMIAMRDTLARNFDIKVRWEDPKARDTFENASNSARLLLPEGIRKIILVTHSTHMWRSVHEYQAAGFEVHPAPVGLLATPPHGIGAYVPLASSLLESSQALYELIGEPVRRLMVLTHVRQHLPPSTTTGS